MSMDLEEAGIDGDGRGLLLDELQGRLEAVPGVTGVAVASRLPLSAGGSTTTVVEGYEPEAGTGSVELAWTQIGPGYFETLGVPVLAGRPYEPADVGGDERVVMVNETAALRFWGGAGEAVGRRTRPQGAPDGWFRVIGVTGDVRVARLDEPPTPMLYFLAGRDGPSNPWVLVRTEGEPESLATAMRAALAEVDPDLGVAVLSTLDAHVGEALSTPRLAAGTLALFSALALLLAGIGIYTLASLSVASRRAEIGLRMALGAGRVQVTRMVLWRVAVTVGIGLSLGAGALALLSGRLEGLLFGVTLTDPLALLAAVGVLGGSVFLASWIPARRASRLDPVESLRRE